MRSLTTIRDLAGGQIPPLTRTALICGLVTFLLTILIFHPTAGGESPAPTLFTGAHLIPSGDVRAESLVLLDPSAAYLPGRFTLRGQEAGVIGQSEDTPFTQFQPLLQFDPGKFEEYDKRILRESPKAVSVSPPEALPLVGWGPFGSFGSTGFKQSGIPARIGYYEVYSLNGANKPIISGNITHFNGNLTNFSDKNGRNSKFSSSVELSLGVDSLGLQAPPAILRSSGDKVTDLSVIQWVADGNWALRLPPGSYRLIVGP